MSSFWQYAIIIFVIWKYYSSNNVYAWMSSTGCPSVTKDSDRFPQRRHTAQLYQSLQAKYVFTTSRIQRNLDTVATNHRHQHARSHVLISQLISQFALSAKNQDLDNDDEELYVADQVAIGPIDVSEYKTHGNEVILRATSLCGITNIDEVNIQWKPNKIVVCIQRNDVHLDMDADGYVVDDDEDDSEDDTQESDDDFDDDSIEFDDEMFLDEWDDDETNNTSIDIVKIARTINQILDDDGGIGTQIAERYEIEVTTPGSSSEISGSIMFRAYRGFDVIVTLAPQQQEEQQDSEMKKKSKTERNVYEGKLVERNNENTIINIKGRMKSIPNGKILSVMLPNAKKE